MAPTSARVVEAHCIRPARCGLSPRIVANDSVADSQWIPSRRGELVDGNCAGVETRVLIPFPLPHSCRSVAPDNRPAPDVLGYNVLTVRWAAVGS